MKKHGFDELFVALFMPVTTILLSMVCLSLTTWAWFTTSVSSGVNEIKAASTWSTANISSQSVNTYTLSAETEEAGNEPINITLSDGDSASLTGENTYIFSITNEGSSHSGYYCLLTFETDSGETEEIYTANFGSQTTGTNDFTFIVTLNKDANVSLQTLWGNPPEDKQTVEDEGIIDLFEPQIEEPQEELVSDEPEEVQQEPISDEPEEVQQDTPNNEIADEPSEIVGNPVQEENSTEPAQEPQPEETDPVEEATPAEETEPATPTSELTEEQENVEISGTEKGLSAEE